MLLIGHQYIHPRMQHYHHGNCVYEIMSPASELSQYIMKQNMFFNTVFPSLFQF